MRGAITDVIAARKQDDGGLERRFVYSLAAHLLVGIACILISSNFPSGSARTNVIEVSFAGSTGAKTSGVAPIAAIERQWNNLQPETGWSEILFELGKDGKLISSRREASSGSFLLDQEALRAIRRATFPPLPPDYQEPILRVRLRFNYGIK